MVNKTVSVLAVAVFSTFSILLLVSVVSLTSRRLPRSAQGPGGGGGGNRKINGISSKTGEVGGGETEETSLEVWWQPHNLGDESVPHEFLTIGERLGRSTGVINKARVLNGGGLLGDSANDQEDTTAPTHNQSRGTFTKAPAIEDLTFWSVLNTDTPRILYLHNTLSSESSAEMIQHATPRLARSRERGYKIHNYNKPPAVGKSGSNDLKKGAAASSEVSPTRTSLGMFVTDRKAAQSSWNQELRRIIGAIVGIPTDWMEATQVLRYTEGQYFKPHTDFFEKAEVGDLRRGGQRIATAITWLNDPALEAALEERRRRQGGVPEEENRSNNDSEQSSKSRSENPYGGDTGFPFAKPQPIQGISPRKGDSVIFFNVNRTMANEVAAMHEGIPVKKGQVKWVAVVWCHPRKYR